MMPISSPFRNPSLMSARTAKYVEAMIRQGDSFDYDSWLRKVREEEASPTRRLASSSSGPVTTAGIKNKIKTSHSWQPARYVARPSIAITTPTPRTVARSDRNSSGTTSSERLGRWLEKVQGARDEFQANRARDAVYDYLQAVFAIVMHFKVRRRTKRLLRHG
jgi:hypothetical protein